MSLKRRIHYERDTVGDEIRSTLRGDRRRRLGHGNRRGFLTRLMQLPDDLISAIQRIVIETQIHLSAPVRQLMNNPHPQDHGFGIVRDYGWGGGGEFLWLRGGSDVGRVWLDAWRENIRGHLYARNVQGNSDNTHHMRQL